MIAKTIQGIAKAPFIQNLKEKNKGKIFIYPNLNEGLLLLYLPDFFAKIVFWLATPIAIISLLSMISKRVQFSFIARCLGKVKKGCYVILATCFFSRKEGVTKNKLL